MKYLGIKFRLDYYSDYAVDYAVRKFSPTPVQILFVIIPTLLLKSRSYIC